MDVCVDKGINDLTCLSRITKCKDGNLRCSNHYAIFNYGYCKERHLTRVKATGKDGLCGAHRSGKTMKKVLQIGDVSKNGIVIVGGPTNSGSRYIWNVICPICKKEYLLPTGEFDKRKSCEKCKGFLYRKSSKDITWKNHYGMVKGRKVAKKKGFDLTLDQFINISSMNCHYCGAFPSPTKGHRQWSEIIHTNGLDRVDSSMGYLSSNVVPCCKDCNVAKLDKTEKEFISWLKRIATHQGMIM